MAVQRLTLTQIETAVLQACGWDTSALAPWKSQANFYLRVNQYMQRLPQKLSSVAQALRKDGIALPYNGIPRFDMWKSSATLTATSGSATVHFPVDYDHWISFYDDTNSQAIYPAESISRYQIDLLKKKAGGPPEAIDILGYVLSGSDWVRKGTIYPATITGTTPSITVTYWRIPAKTPGDSPTTEYLDIDPKYENIGVFGTASDLMRSTDKEYERYRTLELDMLKDMAFTARGM